jgi:hypothetical protein
MNSDGYYMGWADFSVYIPFKSPLDFTLHFHGNLAARYNERYGLREYLEETIYWAIEKTMDKGAVEGQRAYPNNLKEK